MMADFAEAPVLRFDWESTASLDLGNCAVTGHDFECCSNCFMFVEDKQASVDSPAWWELTSFKRLGAPTRRFRVHT